MSHVNCKKSEHLQTTLHSLSFSFWIMTLMWRRLKLQDPTKSLYGLATQNTMTWITSFSQKSFQNLLWISCSPYACCMANWL